MSVTDEPCPRHISTDRSGLDCMHWQSKPTMDQVHYSHVIMGTMASQITSLTIVYSTVYSGADQRKHQSPAFDNMVLSAATVSRLPWRSDVTISLSRIASNITVPNFCYNNMFYSVTNVLLFFNNTVHWVEMSMQKFWNFPGREIIMDSSWYSSMTCD